ncbi:PqqD family peptide modification chaperone [Halomonas campisalis]|uniref:PqqD family peptide modification chaperone n=1 Tax=Billgrantia campisalis TaxID=74661 RepID=A0ABS9P8N6_9GAMM|nr:PqqD family peptide modification chaperone [Halomonas campisalis]MCG6658138.1 PqqD family peptide modification chaperone [Halomonas campisalis]MDR5862806.1 PqqD family peptide modification chaperone [Halomonas campisalis]
MTEQLPPTPRFWLGGKRAAEQDRFFREALEPLGWQQGDAEHWEAAWITGMPEPAQFRRVSSRRKLNHFPGNAALTVKSRLHESLSGLRRRLVDGYGEDHPLTSRLDFFPHAYVMPHDYHALQQAALDNPRQRWILKPTNASKGKGVRVLRDVAEAPLAPDWLVQEYLDNPHTIRGHKYVLRLYVLISSLAPLRVYLYRQGFAKLASEPWDPDDADNPFSQLTNPDINALNTSAEVPVEFIDLDRYRAWLGEQGHDAAALFARIEDLVTLTAIAGVDAMRSRTAAVGADPRGCYELLGLDCMVDDTLKPWILECNLSPSLGICAAPENGGRIEEQVKGSLVRDMIALVDLANTDDTDSEAAEASDPLAETQAELARAGGFQRLLPAADPLRYLACFSLPTPQDLALADALAGQRVPRPRLVRRRVSELYDDDRLALYAPDSGRLYRPNDTAALIWLLATEGLEPEAIAEALAAAASPEPGVALEPEALRREVWSTLGEWCRAGLLCQGEVEPLTAADPPQAQRSALPQAEPPRRLQLEHEGRHWALEVADAAALCRLQAWFDSRLAALDAEAASRLPRLAVLKAAAGYALVAEGTLIASRLSLADIAPALVDQLLRQAAAPGQLVIDAGLLVTPGGRTALCAAADAPAREALSTLAASLGGGLSRGVRLVPQEGGARLEPLGLPWSGAVAPLAAAVSERLSDTPVVSFSDKLAETDAPVPLARFDALAALLPGCRAALGEPPSAEAVQALDRWLQGRPCHSVGAAITATQLITWLDTPEGETARHDAPADSVSAGA